MTLAEALAKVRYLLDEPTAKMWADAELEGYISQGQKAMCQRRGIEEVWTAEISAAETVELPTDFATIQAGCGGRRAGILLLQPHDTL